MDGGQRVVDVGQHPRFGGRRLLELLPAPGQRGGRAGQRSSLQGPAAGLQQQGRGLHSLSGHLVQFGRQLAQRAWHARVRCLDRRRGRGGVPGQERGEQIRHDRVPGQRVPEPEDHLTGTRRLDQLGVAGPLQCGEHLGLGRVHHGGNQRPVELPPEHRGSDHDIGLLRAEPGQPVSYRLGDRGRDAGGHLFVRPPALVAEDQFAGGDRGGEHLLDGERQPVAVGEQPLHDLAVHVLLVQAVGDHQPDVGGGQPGQVENRGGPAGVHRPDHVQCRGRRAVAQRRHAQHGLAGEVVGQVLHDRQGLRVGEMQVFQHQQRALAAQAGEQAE